MARQRRFARENDSVPSDSRNTSKDGRKPKPFAKPVKPKSLFEKWTNKVAIFVSFNIIILILSIVYFCYQYYLENIVITPLDLPKVVTNHGLDVPSMYWGSYRPGLYFGMQTRSSAPLMFGIMWFTQKMARNGIDIRHWCEQWSSVKKYGWSYHDGESFGVEDIVEDDYSITPTFIKQPGGKHGGDFTIKIFLKSKNAARSSTPISLLFYTLSGGNAVLQPFVSDESQLTAIHGQMDSLGKFKIQFHPEQKGNVVLKFNYLRTLVYDGATHLKETVLRNLGLYRSEDKMKILGLVGHAAPVGQSPDGKRGKDFLVHQVTFFPPFTMEISFESGSFHNRTEPLLGEYYNNKLALHVQSFIEKFRDIFKLSSKGYNAVDESVAQALFSNMLGGIGYFYGSSYVLSAHNKSPVSYWDAPLYTAVPSRSFFPRGFLWDEGFHNLLILQWNANITKDIIGHWLDLMNVEGWIPREQILGPEARERVPRDFVVQKNTNANPPTFFLTLESLLHKMKNGDIPDDQEFFKRALPRLKVWFQWFNRTQSGMFPGTYRWRGRDHSTNIELNPKTLTSGLDDYPRASHPTIEERHVDLRCWITFAAKVLADIADHVGEPAEAYRYTYNYLSDNRLLDRLHWSPNSKSYSDYGFHSMDVRLVKQLVQSPPESDEPPKTEMVRITYEQPDLRYVDNFGYVSLFPLLLQVISPMNPKLGKVLEDIKDPNLLWTAYGLRSLSKGSPYYMKHNTEHDPPYWRGPVWININYLALKALHYYSQTDGPYQKMSGELYQRLRRNVVTNLLKEYDRTGFLWEQYNDKTGHGQGSHSFTGWSALVVLIMAELY